MKSKLLIAIAAMIAMSANAEIKREDYPSYSAYLAAQSAKTAAEMDKEYKTEDAPDSSAKKVADDYSKVPEDRFTDIDTDKIVNREEGTISVAHNTGRTSNCYIEFDHVVVARKEGLRDREEWIYKHDGPISDEVFVSAGCTYGNKFSAREDNDGTRLILKNLRSKTYVCRVRIKGKETVDTIIPPDISRSFSKRKDAGYSWNCNAGTEYTGDLSKEPMQVAKEG